MKKLYDVKFYNVGQGLFAELNLELEGKDTFRIVYDCGTLNKQIYMRNALQEFTERSKKPIDLLVLSHFDRDHISGVLDLISRVEIKLIMLPMASHDIRIAASFLKRGYQYNMARWELETLSDPVKKFSEEHERYHPESPQTKFIFVNSAKPYESNEDIPTLEVEGPTLSPIQLPRVSKIPSGYPLGIGNYEFLISFYNDIRVPPTAPNFELNVSNITSILTDSSSSPEVKKQAFEELRELFQTTFKGSARLKNIISLFTYIRPAFAKENVGVRLVKEESKVPSRVEYNPTVGRFGALFTGDGYIESETVFEELKKALKFENNIAILQVMHHGSKSNWYRGLAQSFSPVLSVFSSDPDRKTTRHPHESVLKDFVRYGAICVDRDNSCEITVIKK